MDACPGCGAVYASQGLPKADRLDASGECLAAYHTLTVRTLELGDAAFVHQHVVDAYAAQHVGDSTRKIATFFSLAGLYLALERGLSGREVQSAHVRMSRGEKDWPSFIRPPSLRAATVADVRSLEHDLKPWMADVWKAWTPEHERVRELTDRALIGPIRREG